RSSDLLHGQARSSRSDLDEAIATRLGSGTSTHLGHFPRRTFGSSYRVAADFCVCTIPPTVLRSIKTNLPASVQASVANLPAMSTGKMGLQFQRRFCEEDDRILGGIKIGRAA